MKQRIGTLVIVCSAIAGITAAAEITAKDSFVTIDEIEATGDEPLSIHRLQLEQYADFPVENHTRTVQPARSRTLTHTVYGWYPYWMGSAYLNLDWDLISHLSFFSIEADAMGQITNDHSWPQNWSGLITTAQNAGVTLTLTCTLFGSSAINTLIGSSTYRSTLIANLIAECQAGGAQGVNIDFEGSNLNALNLVTFMTELRTAFDAAIPDAHISMATPAVDWTGCFDYDMLAAQCDTLIPMCYDYHWSGGSPGPVSPLTAGTIWSQWCIEWTVADYRTYGAPDTKITIGVPYYGFDWRVDGDPSTYPVPDGTGDAEARVYKTIRNSHGGYTKHWDIHSQTPWYYYWSGSDPQQVWYDDEVSLGLKYDFVLDENLPGIGIWALGYDDGYMELWDAIAAHFSVAVTPTPTPTTPPVPTNTPAPTDTPVPTLTSTPTAEPTPWAVIVDNQDPGCSTTGGHWVVGTYGAVYGPDKVYSSTGTGMGAATFATVVPSGAYHITAWVNDAGYASAAQYMITHAGGTDIVVRSQANQGGAWCIDLGVFTCNGDVSVAVSDDASTGIVVADAVRWELTGNACLHHGDVDFNAILTAGDAQITFTIVLGVIIPTYEEACAADCTGDDAITAADAQAIFMAVLGSGTCVDALP
ncbi:hypothetical protein JXA80_09195 [bacterium]|nr:hypothetical protein [candidate division CSSED10-310 bacterium]